MYASEQHRRALFAAALAVSAHQREREMRRIAMLPRAAPAWPAERQKSSGKGNDAAGVAAASSAT